MSASKSITTPAFHANVNRLIKKTTEPCEAVNYRGTKYISDEKYVLLHEEEQHLADDLGFLAQTRPGPDSVSAVTLEQCLSPPCLIIRLASNKTPAAKAVEHLRRVVNVVADSAITGSGRESFKARLLDCVVEMSRDRLHTRIYSCHMKKKWPPRSKTAGRPMYAKIDKLVEDIHSTARMSAATSKILNSQFAALKASLQAVESSLPEHQVDLLKSVVTQCFSISHFGSTKSLETHLEQLGCAEHVHQSPTVLQIDKIGRYYSMCDDLIRFSRRRDCRAVFSDIVIKALTAPPKTTPEGATLRCCVHGEVQLVLFHERHASDFTPRAIGSSKSACFLCDLFIAKHGRFSISHTHKRLYEQWRIPHEAWMTQNQERMFARVVEDMNRVMEGLINGAKRKIRTASGAESRTHILLLPVGVRFLSPTPTASHVSSTRTLQAAEVASMPIEVRTLSEVVSVASSTSTLRRQRSFYASDDLTVEINVPPKMVSCVLVVAHVEYIFDVSELDHGHIHISRAVAPRADETRVNARGSELDMDLDLWPKPGEQSLTFRVHDQGESELRVVVTWGKISEIEKVDV